MDNCDMQTTPAAKKEYDEFTKKVAHAVTGMSESHRMGDLRRKAIVSENDAVNLIEIKMAKELRIACVAADGDMSKCSRKKETDENMLQYNNMLERLEYSDLCDIDTHIQGLEQRYAQTDKNRKIAMENSGTNEKFTSFVKEWRSINKRGAHGGDMYVKYLRDTGARLLQERHVRDAHWLKNMKPGNTTWDL